MLHLLVASVLIVSESEVEVTPDEGVRRVLERVASSYLEPERLDLSVMSEGGLRAVADRVAPEVIECAAALAAAAEPDSDLVAALAPSFELVLTSVEPDRRGEVRAALLHGALRAVDRWGAVSGGAAQRDAFRRLEGTYAGVGLRNGRRERLATTIDSERREDGVALIRIRRISQSSLAEMRRHLERLRSSGDLEGIVIDLRGNSGGSILTSARLADLFLSEGTLVENLDRRGQPASGLRPRLRATANGDTTTPLAVLVDRRSASGAELLAAALTRHGRATLVGERTFGKGVAQALFAMPEFELTLCLTTAYVHVAGQPLPSDGLVPEVIVPEGAKPEDVAARAVLRAE